MEEFLTLNRVILHTVVHYSSTSTYMPNFTEIKETFCGRTYAWTFETHFIMSTILSIQVGWPGYAQRTML